MNKYSRENWEQELMGILVNYPDLIDKLNFQSTYFKDNLIAKIFEFMKAHKEINSQELIKTFSDSEIDFFMSIYSSNVYSASADSIANGFAKLILEAYKKETIDNLEQQRKLEMIDTDTYYLKTKEIKELNLSTDVGILTEDELNEIIEDDKKGISIERFGYLADCLKLDSTDLVTIAAISGFGKSAFLLNLYQSLSQSKTNNFKCQYFNLEVAPKVMVKRLLAITSNHKMIEFNKENIKTQFVIEAKQKVKNDSFIKSGSMDVEELKSIVLKNLDKQKQNVIFVDHIGLLGTKERAFNKTEYDRTTYCIKELRKMCLDSNILMFVASQFDRDSVKSKNISMHSLKSSGELENSSTHVLLLKESEKLVSENKSLYEEVMIDIAKNRNGPVNKLDYYTFQKEKQRFIEAIR